MNKDAALGKFAVAAAVFLLLSWVQLEPGDKGPKASDDLGSAPAAEVTDGSGDVANGIDSGGAAGPTATGSQGSGPGGTATTVAGTGGATRPGLQCARGKNGGATDTGVTATKVKLATTAVLDGPAKSLLEDSPVAMKAVVDKVNKAGGICGRLLDLTVVNDSFKFDYGQSVIRTFISEGYFALPVVPSAEGLGAAIESGLIAKAGIPVVGTDGLRSEQYNDPFVWPVASATVTAMRTMAKYGATNRGSKTFAIVWDQKYKFGREGKDAFVEQVTKKLGGAVVADIPLDPDSPSYNTQAQAFNTKCGNGACDMVALLLLPETATKWLKAGPTRALKYTAGAQTLFTNRFAQDCVQQRGNECHGFAVWTGYNPPIGPLASLPGVAAYVNDVKAVKSNIDVNNQFVEGAYLGMSVFVEALKRVGPDLTRVRLRAAMDSMTFGSDLASALTWKPGGHAANVRSQSFALTTSQGNFQGWANEATGFLLDPAHGG